MQIIELNYQVFGETTRPSLIILHGLLGSARNWSSVAKQLSDQYCVYILDLRNHGESPHAARMDYLHMAADVLGFIEQQQIQNPIVLGHSMGGKVAMWMALTQAQTLRSIIIVDIAPVAYANHYSAIFKGMQSLPLEQIDSRQQADQHLADFVTEQGMRQFLLQNLMNKGGTYKWRIGLQAIANAIPDIVGFPEIIISTSQARHFPALFIAGGNSDYVLPEHYQDISLLFPSYQLETIANTGHWVHAEQPQAVVESVRGFVGVMR